MTAIGDTPAIHLVLVSGAVDSAQVPFNLLNPTAGFAVPAGFPGDYHDRLLDRTRAQRVGVIVIRVLAAERYRVNLRRPHRGPGSGSHRLRSRLRDRRRPGPDVPRPGEGGPRRERGRGCAPDLLLSSDAGVDGAPRLLEPRASRGRRIRRGEGPAARRGPRAPSGLLGRDGRGRADGVSELVLYASKPPAYASGAWSRGRTIRAEPPPPHDRTTPSPRSRRWRMASWARRRCSRPSRSGCSPSPRRARHPPRTGPSTRPRAAPMALLEACAATELPGA